MKILSLVSFLFLAGNAIAWTPPDYTALQNFQSARDSARVTQQQQRLDQARRTLSETRNRVSSDNSQTLRLQADLATLTALHSQRLAALESQRGAVTDLYTTARQTAGDLLTILHNSTMAPPTTDLEQKLGDLATSPRALDINALGGLWEGLHLTLTDTALQTRQQLSVQTEPGVLQQQTVTRLGTVLAVAGDRLVVFDRVANLYRAMPPDQSSARQLSKLGQADEALVVVPFQSGTITESRSEFLLASIRGSGPIGLLIVGLGGIGVIVLFFRAALVYRLLSAEKHSRSGSAGQKMRQQFDSHSNESSESLAGWLNAALRREIQRAQWGHTLLSVIIGVSPLLGLLGTVTGMILTFHALRLFGTGDPVLMADGIAQALSTTMLGLLVAIPLLIGQRWLLAQANRHVRKLDALALALTATAGKTI